MTNTTLNLQADENDEIKKEGEISINELEEQKDDKEDAKNDIEEKDSAEEKKEEDNIKINKSKIVLIKKLLLNIKENNDKLVDIFSGILDVNEESKITIGQIGDEQFTGLNEDADSQQDGKIIEGVFDGENMIGPDGKQYGMPANYASKSKLVEGDIMKLIITDRGTFIYKQIGPTERQRIVGELEQDSSGNFYVKYNDKKWRVLTASVTYYKGQSGDETVILVPKNGESKWAAVENIIRSKQE